MVFNFQMANFLVDASLVIVTFLAVIVALFGNAFWNWKRKPKINVECGNFQPYTLCSPSISDGLLFRIKIINKGKTVARNCQVKLLSVKAIDGKNVLDKEESDKLKWSGSPRDMGFRVDPVGNIELMRNINQLIPIHKEKKDITPKGGSEFCDLFWVGMEEPKLIFYSSGRRNFTFEKEGMYFAVIEISGDNIEPIRKGIRIYTPWKVDYSNNNIAFLLAGIKEVKDLSK